MGSHNSDPPPLFKGGEVNFAYLPQKGGSEFKKGGGGMVQGQVFLKGEEGWHFSYSDISSFIIFKFRNYFALGKFMLCV